VPTEALDGAIDLVRNRLMPQDAVAVMGFHRTTDFTTNHEAVAEILERYKTDHENDRVDINRYLEMSRTPRPWIQRTRGTPAGRRRQSLTRF
jgi:hypothetical protein